MELDFRFKQYEVNAEQVNEASGIIDNTKPSKPHQEIIDYIEKNKENFSYKEMLSIVSKVHGVVELNLEDGSEVKIGVNDGIINFGIMFPDKSKFVAAWTNIADTNEFLDKCRNVK